MSQRLEQLLKLFEVDPDDAELTYMIALEKAKADLMDKAVNWLDRTISLQPGHCYAYYQKGRLLAELGRGSEARQTLRSGIEQAVQAGDDKARNELTELLESVESTGG